MIMHKDIFFKLEGFDQKFFMYNEDVDFCLRAKVRLPIIGKREIIKSPNRTLAREYLEDDIVFL